MQSFPVKKSFQPTPLCPQPSVPHVYMCKYSCSPFSSIPLGQGTQPHLSPGYNNSRGDMPTLSHGRIPPTIPV